MSRWDVSNVDNNDSYKNIVEHEEARLLKKFEDYRELERVELEKSKYVKATNNEKTQSWTRRFMSITIIQTFIITGLTVFLMFMEFVNYDVKMMASFLALGVLGSEIIFLTKYFRKKQSLEYKRDIPEFKNKTEFDII
jgi:hypothetical protein